MRWSVSSGPHTIATATIVAMSELARSPRFTSIETWKSRNATITIKAVFYLPFAIRFLWFHTRARRTEREYVIRISCATNKMHIALWFESTFTFLTRFFLDSPSSCFFRRQDKQQHLLFGIRKISNVQWYSMMESDGWEMNQQLIMCKRKGHFIRKSQTHTHPHRHTVSLQKQSSISIEWVWRSSFTVRPLSYAQRRWATSYVSSETTSYLLPLYIDYRVAHLTHKLIWIPHTSIHNGLALDSVVVGIAQRLSSVDFYPKQ